MRVSALLDSNILVYAFDAAYPDKMRIAQDLITRHITGKKTYAIAVQNLTEFFVNVTSKAIRPPADAREILSDLAAKLPCCPADPSTVEYAASLAALYKIPFWDALIAAVMLENNILTIYTENEKDFARIPGIKVVNPFKQAK
jgi:predicted nucleic acid-binding protein